MNFCRTPESALPFRALNATVEYEYYLLLKKLTKDDKFRAEEEVINEVIGTHYESVWDGSNKKVKLDD